MISFSSYDDHFDLKTCDVRGFRFNPKVKDEAPPYEVGQGLDQRLVGVQNDRDPYKMLRRLVSSPPLLTLLFTKNVRTSP